MSETYTVDNLFTANQVQPVVAQADVVAAGQQLQRGCVVGRDSGTTATYSEEHTFPDSDEDLVIKLDDKTAKTDGLVVKKGSSTLTISTDYTVSKDGTSGEVSITRVDSGALAKKDKVTVTFTGNNRDKGQLKAVDSSATGLGYDHPFAVLGIDVDSRSGSKNAPVYLTGEFNETALSFGGTDTLANHDADLRKIGIIVKKNI